MLLAGAALGDRDYTTARKLYVSLLDRPEAKPFRSLLQNNLAWTYVMLADPALLDEAARLSELALRDNPKSGPFLGTRGAVLLELGKVHESVDLLRRARAGNDRHNRAINECMLAVASCRLGLAEAAQSHLRAAERLDADCVVLARARRACAEATGKWVRLAPLP
jgi:tetratricopeptide (TPR) repeat protein